MTRMAVLALLLFAFAAPARAGLAQATLDTAYVEPKSGAALPLALSFVDDSGHRRTLADALDHRPGVVIFADYTCRTLCGPILSFAGAALEQSGLRAGVDYRLIVIGLDPKDAIAQARAMKEAQLGPDSAMSRAAVVLTGSDATIKATTDALGYHYAYDDANDQFAHPAAAYVVTPAGRVDRLMSGLGINADDLHLALVDAGQGHVGTLGDRLRLLCYGFDPARGIYTASIRTLLAASAAATVLSLALAIGWMTLRRRGAPS